MYLKVKKILVVSMLCIMGFSSTTVLAETTKEEWKNKGPIFMGKVLEVERNDKDKNIRVKVKGYIRGCEVYEEELIAIVNEDTDIILDRCNKENKAKDKNSELELELKDINIEKGDNVFIRLDKAMTMSLPPQSLAKKIQITKIKD